MKTIQQHEPLRTPSNWSGQERQLVAQLERTFEDLYSRFNRLTIKDMAKGFAKSLELSTNESITLLSGLLDGTNSRVDLTNESITLLSGLLDGTNSHMELTPEQINMVGGIIRITTDDFLLRLLKNGTEGLQIDADGVSSDLPISTPLLLSPSVMSVYTGNANIPWQGSIQATIDSVSGNYLTKPCTINIPDGTYQENIIIENINGASLSLKGKATIVGSVFVRRCTSRIALIGIDESNPLKIMAVSSTTNVVFFQDIPRFSCMYVRVTGRVRANASDTTATAIWVEGASGYIRNSIVERCNNGINVTAASTVEIYYCSGGVDGGYLTLANLNNGIGVSRGSFVGINGTIPMGVASATSEWFGLITGTGTPTGSPGTAPPVPTTRTLVYNVSESGYLEESPSNLWLWKSGTTVWQANSTTYGQRCGFWCLENSTNIASQIGSGTITKVEIELQRTSAYGSSDAVDIHLRSHNYPTKASYTWGTALRPTMSDVFGSYSFERNQKRVIELPSSVHAGLKGGTIKGFALRNNSPVVQMTGVCILRITVEGGP